MLQFLFGPMFEATIDPKSHPEMAKFMTQVCKMLIMFSSSDEFWRTCGTQSDQLASYEHALRSLSL